MRTPPSRTSDKQLRAYRRLPLATDPIGGLEKTARAALSKLGDDDYFAREKAFAELVQMGETVRPLIRAEMERSDDPEVVDRCRQLLNRGRIYRAELTTSSR